MKNTDKNDSVLTLGRCMCFLESNCRWKDETTVCITGYPESRSDKVLKLKKALKTYKDSNVSIFGWSLYEQSDGSIRIYITCR